MKWLTAIVEGLIRGLFGARRESKSESNKAITVPTDNKTKKTVNKLRDKINKRLNKVTK
jgi:hypothetical protein